MIEEILLDVSDALLVPVLVLALAALLPFAWNRRMEDAIAGIVEQCGRPGAEADRQAPGGVRLPLIAPPRADPDPRR